MRCCLFRLCGLCRCGLLRRLLEATHHSTHHGNPDAHADQSLTASGLACGLDSTCHGLLHEGSAPVSTQRVRLLHVREQRSGVLVVLDGCQSDPFNEKATPGTPLVVLFDGLAEGFREPDGILL